jgi:hypothetical protein
VPTSPLGSPRAAESPGLEGLFEQVRTYLSAKTAEFKRALAEAQATAAFCAEFKLASGAEAKRLSAEAESDLASLQLFRSTAESVFQLLLLEEYNNNVQASAKKALQQQKKKKTNLADAAEKGDAVAVARLLAAGANVDEEYWHGQTAVDPVY